MNFKKGLYVFSFVSSLKKNGDTWSFFPFPLPFSISALIPPYMDLFWTVDEGNDLTASWTTMTLTVGGRENQAS